MSATIPQPTLAKKLLTDAVASAFPAETGRADVLTVGQYDLQISGNITISMPHNQPLCQLEHRGLKPTDRRFWKFVIRVTMNTSGIT